MKKYLSLFALCLLFSSLSFNAALAEIFYWKDPHTNIALTYPDRWQVRSNMRPDDVLTVYAPGENDHAMCRLRVRDDRRFAIYPEYLDANVQHIAYSHDFWKGYTSEYDNVTFEAVYDDAGLSRGFASMASVEYITAYGPKMEKKALMFASLYNKNAYIVECSAEKSSYPKWHNSFLSLIKSISFRKEINEAKGGYYRDFFGEKIRIKGQKKIDINIH